MPKASPHIVYSHTETERERERERERKKAGIVPISYMVHKLSVL